jgi:hypothetical protein
MTILVMSTDEMRRTLADEGVFGAVETVDEPMLRIMWNVRRSPEYGHRLSELCT